MVRPLLSDSQMAAIQRTALAGMKVEVVILRPNFTSDDLGDEAFDEDPQPVTQPASALRDGTLYGYLRQTSGDTQGGVDIGMVVASSTFQLGVPLSADVASRDIALINGSRYVIQNVNDNETWPAMLNLDMRLRS